MQYIYQLYHVVFYGISLDILAIFWYFFPYSTIINYEKHCITVLSYNYLIFGPHDVFSRQFKTYFFKCMYSVVRP